MRVEPSGNSIKITQPAPNSAPQAAGKAAPVGGPAEAGTFSPTSQLSQLLEGVRRAPDVRSDAVQAAAARVASGELSTPDAASETAQAILAGDAGGPG
ncbi:unnamed protein product [Gemmataceae bacterium]|nr:unnamed protein product [Gemmataceae bacterium]VTT97873.1 unnamed protein product [Gemmataceae bacterium]